MFWALLYLLQAYVVGFYCVSNRAKTALEAADKHWPEGEEDCKRDVDGYHGYKNITLLNSSQQLYTKKEWTHYNRNIHMFWFITSLFWADIICVIKFVKFIVADINPRLALAFETDFKVGLKPMYVEQNLQLKKEIERMQAQFDALALEKKPVKKPVKKRKTKKK